MYAGPRGLLFKQILPGAEPLLDLMQQIAEERSRSVSQVSSSSVVPCCIRLPSDNVQSACFNVTWQT